MFAKKLNQKGVFHIQSLLIFVVVVGVIASAGYYVLQKSRAGTNPYSNGALTDGYFHYTTMTSPPTYTNPTPSMVVGTAFPTNCKVVGGEVDIKRTWSPTKTSVWCGSTLDSYHPSQSDYRTLYAIGYDNSSPVEIMRIPYQARDSNGGPIDGSKWHTSMAFEKNGNMSKIAFIEGTEFIDGNTPDQYRVGVYNVTDKTFTYLKDISGSNYVSYNHLGGVDWSPDGSKLYFSKNEYIGGVYSFRVCSIATTGGTVKCVAPKGTTDGASQSDWIWSYDMGSLYFSAYKSDGTSDVYRYAASYGTLTKIITNGTVNVLHNISPDSRYLLTTSLSNNIWNGKIYDTKSNTYVTGTPSNVSNLVWQPIKTGTVAITEPPDSGPILVSNYSVSCTASYGRYSSKTKTLPVTVVFTNNGPDASPSNVGIVTAQAPTNITSIVSVPLLSPYGSYSWTTNIGPLASKTTYSMSSDYRDTAGKILSSCSGTKTLTTR